MRLDLSICNSDFVEESPIYVGQREDSTLVQELPTMKGWKVCKVGSVRRALKLLLIKPWVFMVDGIIRHGVLKFLELGTQKCSVLNEGKIFIGLSA